MTPPNLTPQSADVALDPMAGTFAELRNIESSGAAPDSFARVQTRPLGLDAAQAGLFAPEAPAVAVNVCILALDLGTKTGYAVRKRDGKVVHGTQSFAPRTSWSAGQRWLRFQSWLGELLDLHRVDQIAYEHVSFHAGVRDAHCYGAFRALVEMAADRRNIGLVGTNVQTVKRHWTGKGGADKAAMIAQARARGFRPETDNDADALAVLDWAVAQEKTA
ncbi:crossover junction endodeoxyribonuclease RuvC [Achromobacter aegrifaciens]|uniref:crossover junction endodeoxyribonuclease RuvC n=1 Tax=Achromobacter aegrifaciens TaxID=1287736 RepID=UPI0027B912F0|nr:crossover junction endodeoxyribonuclease RuvC [Achromobacter aegrifaciens]WLW64295.1 crossover junction endodeoxyribonuclease RuvC [Achromobacter aegrifaciens]